MPKTRWATTIDGASIAYQDFGKGPVTLLVIHGWISHLEVYWEQPRFARFMRRLSRNMRVLHFDKRGAGMSDRFGRPPDLETRMDDVRAVMDAAGVERAALFGWGTGGPPLAAFFAATHPERTLAVCMDGYMLERRDADYPWGWDEDEFDYVYHLAAYAAEGLSHFIRRFNYTNNLIGSVNLINQSVLHDVKCFVFTSSIAVYDQQLTMMTPVVVQENLATTYPQGGPCDRTAGIGEPGNP